MQGRKGTGEKDDLGAEADGVPDAAGPLEPGAATTTMAERVHRDARLAFLCLWAC
jgi:hypothetical protein